MIQRVRLAARRRWWLLCAALCALVGAGAAIALNSLPREGVGAQGDAVAEAGQGVEATPAAPPAGDPTAEAAPDVPPADAVPADPLAGVVLDPAKFTREGAGYVQRLSDGRVVHLTLSPAIQDAVGGLFDKRKVPHGGLVAIEPATGRVLGMVSKSHAANPSHMIALRANAPAASVFKSVTAAALLEKANLDPARKVCYEGGLRALSEDIIKGSPGADAQCGDLGDALAHSINAVIARLSYYHLTRAQLEEMALRFGFNRQIPFELPVDVSNATFVDDDIERARTAAGFWNVNLSPLHGAMIAAAISNDGIMMRPTLIDRITGPDGATLYTHTPQPWLVPIQPAHARVIATLSEATTTVGTAADGFKKDATFPKHLRVTGKTGTLSNKSPHLTYTWFVGASPPLKAEVAVGSLVVNTPKWWIKGFHGAATAIRAFDQAKSGGGPKKPKGAPKKPAPQKAAPKKPK